MPLKVGCQKRQGEWVLSDGKYMVQGFGVEGFGFRESGHAIYHQKSSNKRMLRQFGLLKPPKLLRKELTGQGHDPDLRDNV